MSSSAALVPVLHAATEQLLQNPALLLSELFQERQQAAYWQAMFRQAKERETQLEKRTWELEARIKQFEHQLFGKKSEKKSRSQKCSSSSSESPAGGKRKRGQQPGNPGPQRRDYDHLPKVEEQRDLSEDQKRCPTCQLPYEPFPGTEDSETIEIDVRAHRRVIRRKRYRRTCQCPATPGIITAPPSPKLIPKGRYGISIWVQVLLDKFLFFRPSHRLIADFATHGIQLAPGTLTEGLKRLAPLLEPVYEAIKRHCQAASRWHGDETGWKVFVQVEEKPGHKRTLWVFSSPEAVVFVIALTRGAKEAEAFFGAHAAGILNVDRYSSYKALLAVKGGTLILAFCWSHVRRDFLEAERGWDGQQPWVAEWIGRIGELFHVNQLRVTAWEDNPRGEAFARHDAVLRTKIEEFRQARDGELQQEKHHPARHQVLTSLVNHWDGLTVFVDHPEVPMDNSEAERKLRGPAIGRKNYWGSGAEWAADLAERSFSLFATLLLADLNVRTWMTAFLTACAEAGARVPTFFEQLLPWNLTDEQQEAFRQPPSGIELPPAVRRLLDALAQKSPGENSSAPPPALPPPEEVLSLPTAEEALAKPPPKDGSFRTTPRHMPTRLPCKYSGRAFTSEQVQQIRQLIAASPRASRAAISREVCRLLDWRKPDGGLKEMSCRVALLRMQRDGLLTLPAPRHGNRNGRRYARRTSAAEPQTVRELSLAALGEVRLEIVTAAESQRWNEHIDRYHYLGYHPLPGAQLRYFAYAGEELLALFGYGASAWRLAPRDGWIGWNDSEREAGLPRVVGQARFLILPWIRCPNLATKLLSLSAARLPSDWDQRYGIRPLLLETFVDTSRFLGTCYRAANWIAVGQTRGRGKKDRHRLASLPTKQVYLYPLCRNCQDRLCQ
jgi:transposase